MLGFLLTAMVFGPTVNGQTVPGSSPQAAESCDQACLIGTVDAYFAALLARDPSRLAIAPDAKFTENTNVIRAGEGLWQTIQEGPTKFKVYVPDPVIGQVGFVGVIIASGLYQPLSGRFVDREPGLVFLALRLKVRGREITESEVLLYRPPIPEPRLECSAEWPSILCDLPNIDSVRPGLLAAVPAGERVSREEMLRIADGYYQSIVRSDGDVASFADDCVRHENGGKGNFHSREWIDAFVATGSRFIGVPDQTCRGQMNTRLLSYITSISRRVQIADPETGLVFGLSMFRRPYLEPSRKVVGIPGVETVDQSGSTPSNRLWAHVFKVRGGKLHEIEAMSGVVLPLDSKSGWETNQD
jgi:hypothetical protein